MNRSQEPSEFKTFRKQSEVQTPLTDTPDSISCKRFSERVGSFSFLPHFQSPKQPLNGFGISRLELRQLEPMSTERLDTLRTENNKTGRLEKSDDASSQPDLLKSRYLTFNNGPSTSNTSSSLIENLPCKTPMSSLREEAYKRQNIRLRAENIELKNELYALQNKQAAIEENKYDRLEKHTKELERNNARFERQLREFERKNELFIQENLLYKQIIEKLQKRIDVLLTQNGHLECALQTSIQKIHELQAVEERMDKVKGMMLKLELQVFEDDKQWGIHKDLWVHQREYYKEIIRKLEFQLQYQTNNHF